MQTEVVVMPRGHFSGDSELNEFLASPRRDRLLLHHVRYCSRCQWLARGRRLQRLATSVDGAEAGGQHVADVTLQAFAKEQLNDGQMMQVMDHLAVCGTCVGALQVLHAAGAQPS